MINISKIKNDKNVKKNLPTQFNTKQNKFQEYIHQLKQYALRYLTIKNLKRH